MLDFKKLIAILLMFNASNLIAQSDTESLIYKTKDSRFFQRAYMLLEQGRYEQADEFIDRALSIRKDVQYQILKARILLNKNPAAVEAYTQDSGKGILETTEGLAIYASALQQVGRYEMSAKAYQWLVGKEPYNGRWWVGMAIAHEYMGKVDYANRMYSTALQSTQMPASVRAYAQNRQAFLASLRSE